jgi:hypothetical protein
MSQYVTVFTFPIQIKTISIIQNSEDKVAPTLRLTFVCFQQVGFLYSRKGPGAASKILPGAGAA